MERLGLRADRRTAPYRCDRRAGRTGTAGRRRSGRTQATLPRGRSLRPRPSSRRPPTFPCSSTSKSAACSTWPSCSGSPVAMREKSAAWLNGTIMPSALSAWFSSWWNFKVKARQAERHGPRRERAGDPREHADVESMLQRAHALPRGEHDQQRQRRAEIGQLDRGVASTVAVWQHFGLVHERRGDDASPSVEGRGCCGAGLERVQPGRFQVDRVGQHEPRLFRYGVEDARDEALGVGVDPGVDRLTAATGSVSKSTLCGRLRSSSATPRGRRAAPESALEEEPVGDVQRRRLGIALTCGGLLGGDGGLQAPTAAKASGEVRCRTLAI